jgi:ribosomal protein L12E/L44/L45/RPP1/RPP2
MEKDIDRIPKNPDTDIVIRIDDFGGKRGLTIREFVRGERYTGFTKSGTRIPAEHFKAFKDAINSVDINELMEGVGEGSSVASDSGTETSGQEESDKKDVEKKENSGGGVEKKEGGLGGDVEAKGGDVGEEAI